MQLLLMGLAAAPPVLAARSPRSTSTAPTAPTIQAPAGAPAQTSLLMQRLRRSGVLHVCVWPDYYGVTYRNPRTQQLSGIDIDLSAELARDLQLRLEYVDSSFPQLTADLNSGRCDVAMFAIGMLASRKAQLAFTQPYLQSDIYGVTTRSNRTVRQWSDIDQPGVIVAVQAGTLMEPVMTEALKQAKIAVVRPPETREQELEAGRVDVFMTNYPYSRRLLDSADWARLVPPNKPFFVLPYGYAVRRGDPVWLAAVDGFVSRIKRDGRLRAAAQRHGLGEIVVN